MYATVEYSAPRLKFVQMLVAAIPQLYVLASYNHFTTRLACTRVPDE